MSNKKYSWGGEQHMDEQILGNHERSQRKKEETDYQKFCNLNPLIFAFGQNSYGELGISDT